MPIIKSAKKRVRQNEKRRDANKALRTYMKNLRKKTLVIIETEGSTPEQIKKAVDLYKSRLDKAWAKGLFKRNKSSRLKSNIDTLVNKKLNSSVAGEA